MPDTPQSTAAEPAEQFPPTPWSPNARSNLATGQRAVEALAGSPARDRLVETIERYCKGDTSGRAILVAGHRGAGKTTTVLAAMQQVYNSSCEKRRTYRPLLVRIHGPALQRPVRPPEAETKDDDDEAKKPELERDPTLSCLIEMAAGMLPALLEHLRQLLHIDGNGVESEKRAPRQELIAYLSDELRRGMPLATLREVYRRLGVLEKGLLCGDPFQEMVAINAAREVYQLVTGKLDDQRGSGAKVKQDAVDVRGTKIEGDTLTKALTPLSAAAVAAFGLASGEVVGALLGAGAIIAGGLTLSRTTTTTRARNADRSSHFVRDTSANALLRQIPLLIDELRRVGFPPVFVVDELDKVDDPDAMLAGLLGELKSYVTERSLMFFITDDGYYERITLDKDHYGRRHTFFGEHAYVLSRPADLHTYLRKHVMLPPKPGASTLVKRLDRVFFRLVLLLESRMHMYDLRAKLRLVRGGEMVRLAAPDPSLVRTNQRRYEVLFQLCIEWIIADQVQQREIHADPFFAQLLYSELYAVVDRWRDGHELKGKPAEITTDDPMLRERDAGQQALIERALRQLFGYLRKPPTLRDAILREYDVDRWTRFATACDGKPDEERTGAQERRFARDKSGRPRKAVAEIHASDRVTLLESLIWMPPVLGIDPTKTKPLVDGRGERVGAEHVDAGEAERLERLRRLAESVAVVEVGFDRLWRSVMPGLAVPDIRIGTDVASALPDADTRETVAQRMHLIERAFHDALVGVRVIAAIRGDETPSERHLAMLEPAAGAFTDLADRRRRIADTVLRVAADNGVALSPDAETLLLEANDDIVFKTEIVDLGTALVVGAPPPVASDLRERWEISLANRIAARLGTSWPDRVDSTADALDVTARARGWFRSTEGTPLGEEFLDTWWRTQNPGEWPIVIWAGLVESDLPALRGVAATRLNHAPLVEASIDALKAGNGGEADDPDRLELLRWLGAELRRLRAGRFPSVALLQPSVVMSQWLPSERWEVGVVRLEDPRVLELTEELETALHGRAVVFSEVPVHARTLDPSRLVLLPPGKSGDARIEARSDGVLLIQGRPPSLDDAMNDVAQFWRQHRGS